MKWAASVMAIVAPAASVEPAGFDDEHLAKIIRFPGLLLAEVGRMTEALGFFRRAVARETGKWPDFCEDSQLSYDCRFAIPAATEQAGRR